MPSQEASIYDFGLLIAYVLPGFCALWGLAYVSPLLRLWITSPQDNAPTIAGFFYLTVGSIAAGLTVSTIRWLVIDSLHHWMGMRQPDLDFTHLQQHVNAFSILVDIHYRYYQFYSNMLVSLALVFAARRMALGWGNTPLGWTDAGFLLLAVVFFLGSRDTLRLCG